MKVKTNNRFLFFYITLIYFNCITSPISAAELEISLTNDLGKPLADAVAALIPVKKIDYTNFPAAIMDQHDNMFVPGVLAIRVNTLVRFPNSDDVRHHVYSFSPAKKFELRLYHGMTAEPVLFDKPGTVVLGCNIHDSMVAHIYVVETEYFANANAQGVIKIEAPAGQYQLKIYHPRLTTEFQETSVTLNEQQKVKEVVTLNNLMAEKNTESTDEFSDLF
jgi:plastocyanin